LLSISSHVSGSAGDVGRLFTLGFFLQR